MTAIQLASFSLTKDRGFLPHQDPLEKLPKAFDAWEHAAQNLPKLLVSDRVRWFIDRLPPFPIDDLKLDSEIHRAMLLLSYLGQAYVFGQKPTSQSVPAVLAVPWYAVATKMGRHPILSYESYALDNWKRLEPSGPIRLGNIALIQNFLAGIDEEWFILIHVDIEAKAGGVLDAICDGLAAITKNDVTAVKNSLIAMGKCLSDLYTTLLRMPEHCDPFIYYHRVRPYIHGWKNNPATPNGILYEGVKEYGGQPQSFRGETGAQSTIIPCCDAFLCVSHSEDLLKAYLMEMREYMPPKHRDFLAAIEKTSTLRNFVMANKDSVPDLKDAYNTCVTWTEKFRTLHLDYAVKYISKQSQVDPSNPSQVGTGGTPFVQYLTKHRDETTFHIV